MVKHWSIVNPTIFFRFETWIAVNCDNPFFPPPDSRVKSCNPNAEVMTFCCSSGRSMEMEEWGCTNKNIYITHSKITWKKLWFMAGLYCCQTITCWTTGRNFIVICLPLIAKGGLVFLLRLYSLVFILI